MQPVHSEDQLDAYRWLASSAGADLMKLIRVRQRAGETVLKLSESLRAHYAPDLVALALTQVELQHGGRAKFADAERFLFTREGLEQATNERIARHRAARFTTHRHIVDLCCGIGGDLMALAVLPGEREVIAVDLDPVHLFLARHNARIVAPHAHITTLQEDVRDVQIPSAAAVFIDPARRDARGRKGSFASEPPVEWSLALAERASAVGIKAAPGIPHELVPDGWELETIAIGNDLKEAALWSPSIATVSRAATIVADDGIHTLVPIAGSKVPIEEPAAGMWLLDPNPAVTRAGLVEDLARSLGAAKIDSEIGFLVTSTPVDSPFARSLRIIGSMPWHEKHLKRLLRDIDAGPVDIRRRGLAGDVAAITKRLRGKGPNRVAIAMTRHQDIPWAIVCDLVETPSPSS